MSSSQCVAVREPTTTQFYNILVYSTILYQPVVPSVPPGDLFKYIQLPCITPVTSLNYTCTLESHINIYILVVLALRHYVFSLQNPTPHSSVHVLCPKRGKRHGNQSRHHAPARQLPPRQITPGDTRSGAANVSTVDQVRMFEIH